MADLLIWNLGTSTSMCPYFLKVSRSLLVWNPAGRSELPGELPEHRYQRETNTSDDAAATYQHPALHHDYNYDDIIRGPERRAEPSLYTSSAELSHQLRLDTLMPSAILPRFTRRTVTSGEIEGLFIPTDRIILEALSARAGHSLTLAALRTLTGESRRSVNIKISRINKILREQGISPILTIVPTKFDVGGFLLEAAEPKLIRASDDFELMKHSFAWKDAQGQLREFGIRHEDLSVLTYLIDQGPTGASNDALREIARQTTSARYVLKDHIRTVIESLNHRLRDSPIWIAHEVQNGRGFGYTFRAR